MEGKKDEQQSIFTAILEDQNNDVPKFLDEVVEFVHSKTKFRGYGPRTIKELFSESVERHFNKKFVATQARSHFISGLKSRVSLEIDIFLLENDGKKWSKTLF